MNPICTVVLECKFKEFNTDVTFIILNNANCVSTLSLKACINLNLIQKVNKVNANRPSELNKFLNKNKEIFEGIGTFSDVMHKINVNSVNNIIILNLNML